MISYYNNTNLMDKHLMMSSTTISQTSQQTIPWIDKYRPNRLDNIVHQPELMKTLKNILETGEMPHLLFHGPPGTGKTTTVLALANELYGPRKLRERVLELNASDDRGISAVRNEIITFAKTVVGNPDPKFKSPPYKILILDEADAMTPDAQSALRKVMEETSSITRFCLICNYVDKIIDPIISRCMQFRFMAISRDTMKRRLIYIAKKEDLHMSDYIYDIIMDVVDGDLRKGIMLLQNIKYIYNVKKDISGDDVYDLVGFIPQKKVKTLVKLCKLSDSKIIDVAREFYSSGYQVGNLCEQICCVLVNDDTVREKTKASILIKIANVCDKLNDGASEMIQLVNLLTFMKFEFNRTC
jgi:replication factor C subunit 2/4